MKGEPQLLNHDCRDDIHIWSLIYLNLWVIQNKFTSSSDMDNSGNSKDLIHFHKCAQKMCVLIHCNWADSFLKLWLFFWWLPFFFWLNILIRSCLSSLHTVRDHTQKFIHDKSTFWVFKSCWTDIGWFINPVFLFIRPMSGAIVTSFSVHFWPFFFGHSLSIEALWKKKP